MTVLKINTSNVWRTYFFMVVFEIYIKHIILIDINKIKSIKFGNMCVILHKNIVYTLILLWYNIIFIHKSFFILIF